MEQKFYKTYKITQLKFWQNFWDYYKVHLLALVLVALTLFVGIRSCVNQVENDLTITYIGENAMLSPGGLKKILEDKVQDMDGDGEVIIDIANNPIDASETPENVTVMLTRVDAEVMAGDPFILMTDEIYIDRFVNMSAMQSLEEVISGLDIPEESVKRDPITNDVIAVNITDMPIGGAAGIWTDTQMFVGVKIMPYSKANNEDYVKRHNQAMDIVKHMLEYEK